MVYPRTIKGDLMGSSVRFGISDIGHSDNGLSEVATDGTDDQRLVVDATTQGELVI